MGFERRTSTRGILETYGMGSIFGGMAFLVGTSYSEMAGAVKSAISSSDSFLYMVLVVVVVVVFVAPKTTGRLEARRGWLPACWVLGCSQESIGDPAWTTCSTKFTYDGHRRFEEHFSSFPVNT
jgi:hypothetical protein